MNHISIQIDLIDEKVRIAGKGVECINLKVIIPLFYDAKESCSSLNVLLDAHRGFENKTFHIDRIAIVG